MLSQYLKTNNIYNNNNIKKKQQQQQLVSCLMNLFYQYRVVLLFCS